MTTGTRGLTNTIDACIGCGGPVHRHGGEIITTHADDCPILNSAHAEVGAGKWIAVAIMAAAMDRARNSNERGDAYRAMPNSRLLNMLKQNVSELDLAFAHDNDVADKLADVANYASFLYHNYLDGDRSLKQGDEDSPELIGMKLLAQQIDRHMGHHGTCLICRCQLEDQEPHQDYCAGKAAFELGLIDNAGNITFKRAE